MIYALTARAVAALVARSCARPMVTVAIGLALAVAAGATAAQRLGVGTGKLHLLPAGHPDVERFRRYAHDFGALDDIVIVIRAQRVSEAAAFAERLVERLRGGAPLVRSIAYRVDPQGFEGRALLYLPLDRLQRI